MTSIQTHSAFKCPLRIKTRVFHESHRASEPLLSLLGTPTIYNTFGTARMFATYEGHTGSQADYATPSAYQSAGSCSCGSDHLFWPTPETTDPCKQSSIKRSIPNVAPTEHEPRRQVVRISISEIVIPREHTWGGFCSVTAQVRLPLCSR
jgi:hypothetical protein